MPLRLPNLLLLCLFFIGMTPTASCSNDRPINIICDLGGVLMDTHIPAAFWHLGPLNYAYYVANSWPKTKPLQRLLYQTFNAIKPRDPQETLACDNHGHLLPQLMCDCLKGTQTPAQLLTLVNDPIITTNDLSHAEKSILKPLMQIIFDAETFINTRKFLPSGLEFLQDCKDRGHRIYLLSNWDALSFSLLEEYYPEFFDYFDGVIVSGRCGLLKPDPAIYQHLLATYQLNPRECIFLDDQVENIIAAQKLGIRSFLIKQTGLVSSEPDFTQVYAALNGYRDFYTMKPLPV